MAIKLTKEDIAKVYDEIDRRVNMDMKDGFLDGDSVEDYYKTLLQGVYGAIMAISDNWCDITSWMDEIEVDRYWWRT